MFDSFETADLDGPEGACSEIVLIVLVLADLLGGSSGSDFDTELAASSSGANSAALRRVDLLVAVGPEF